MAFAAAGSLGSFRRVDRPGGEAVAGQPDGSPSVRSAETHSEEGG